MKDTEPSYRPVPVKIVRRLLNHQLWLNTNGLAGERFFEDLGFEFKNYDLSGVDLSRAYLPGTSFEGGSVRGARFVNAELQYSTFDEGCDVTGADFSDAKLAYAVFETPSSSVAIFAGALDMDRVRWSKADRGQMREEEDLRRVQQVQARAPGKAR